MHELHGETEAKYYLSSILGSFILNSKTIHYISENVIDTFKVESNYDSSVADFLIPVAKWAIREEDILSLKTFFLALGDFVVSALNKDDISKSLGEICASVCFCAVELLKESVVLTKEQWELLLVLKEKGRRVTTERLAQYLNWDIKKTSRILEQLSCIPSRGGKYKELVKNTRGAWRANGV